MFGHPLRMMGESRSSISRRHVVQGAVRQVSRGESQSGGDEGPALNTAIFLSNWDGRTLDELVDRIRNSMPPDDPNTIPRKQIVDMLAQNHFSSGRTAFADGAGGLKNIKFLQSRPY
jgi:hypothetical protein